MTRERSVLVIGGGGREHALCWKLAQSTKIGRIYASPGNPGIARLDKVKLVRLNLKNNEEVAEWSAREGVDLVVVGPEDFLANGVADALARRGIECFGPGAAGAMIEADKRWAKSFMDRHGIPTAAWADFSDADEAKKFVRKSPSFRVVKASGLAAGKGVVVARNVEEACRAIDEILVERKFGSAGEWIVVEEILEGEEVSVLFFTDGKSAETMPLAQDHKRLSNGDLGPNTGGMGAYCPSRSVSERDLATIRELVVDRAIAALAEEGVAYRGVLYAGLMMTRNGPKLLEFNCRFGDPETQVVVPLMTSDLFETMMACCRGDLADHPTEWRNDLYAAGVVLASAGYPTKSSEPRVIRGVERRVETVEGHLVFHSGTALAPDGSGELTTNGGRVLMTVRLAPSLELAVAEAIADARNVSFEGKQFRTDIGHRGIAAAILHSGKTSYRSSGVDIDAGDSLVTRIRPAVATTKRPGLLGGIGGFGGLFDVAAAGYADPILVSGTDGVGTKLKIAIECGLHETVGIDLVAMCVNDVLAHGAEPLFFLDYFACGRLDVDTASKVVSGVAEGCRRAGCALVGGETAEMPDMYVDGEYDLAGFAVGAVERDRLLPRRDIRPNDLVIALPSSGLHSNGFSLVRRVLKLAGKKLQDPAPFVLEKTIGEALLEPTKIYARAVLPAMRSNLIKAFAHVTGGGLTENVPRILPAGTRAVVDATKWNLPSVFGWLATTGGIGRDEMLRTFNCGVGAILVCSPENGERLVAELAAERPVVIGRIEERSVNETPLEVRRFGEAMEKVMRPHVAPLVESLSRQRTKRVGVLVSGSGTNLQALIDACRDPGRRMGAEIVLVVSNRRNVQGLARADEAGIKNLVIRHTDYPSREAFDDAVTKRLEESGVEIVCLAGFMRILSEKFVRRWRGALLNVHPSLLPSFKGAHAHEDVLRAGVRLSGCTVHFVEVEIDSGAIIEQESVPVLPGDTVESLQERVKIAEHRAFPRALKLLANGRVELGSDGTLVWR